MILAEKWRPFYLCMLTSSPLLLHFIGPVWRRRERPVLCVVLRRISKSIVADKRSSCRLGCTCIWNTGKTSLRNEHSSTWSWTQSSEQPTSQKCGTPLHGFSQVCLDIVVNNLRHANSITVSSHFVQFMNSTLYRSNKEQSLGHPYVLLQVGLAPK